ncbi:hypothetical protein BD410DRAFT_437807 [Rickenella mellea]|uniref:Uncharacterized protein n=1 Tax=Rickenella mellea TaxID=50990 RepID=A0A4Y7PWW7_9AGAM|nr:hypothetical protein BD410DRAFT_437807 [Rickenella mellea]
MKSRLLLDRMVGESVTVLELFASEDKVLLVGRIPSWSWIFVLMLLIVFDDSTSNAILSPRDGLDEDLHTTTDK